MINVNLMGIAEVRAMHKRILERCKHPNTVMEVIATKAWKDIIEHFSECEGPTAKTGGLIISKWPPLARPRKRSGSRTKRVGGADMLRAGKPLSDTGRLRGSHRWRVLEREAHVYTNIDYADYHNSDEPRTRLPQRKFLWLSGKARENIDRTIARYIANGNIS